MPKTKTKEKSNADKALSRVEEILNSTHKTFGKSSAAHRLAA